MSNGDYDYFGKGDTGYAQYMTAFNRNFGGSSGSGGGCGADSDRLGWLNQSLQVKHRFSLWGFFESACRKRRSMVT